MIDNKKPEWWAKNPYKLETSDGRERTPSMPERIWDSASDACFEACSKMLDKYKVTLKSFKEK